MFSGWMHFAPSALAGFLAALVECVEALTIILAVGSVRGWREALCGAAAALAVLAVLVAVFGEALEQIPLAVLQIVVGALLTVFGMRWLKKSILRFAGIIPLHDEDATFAAEQHRLGAASIAPGWDVTALATTFQITMLEGAEVVFIVLGIGAGGSDLTDAATVGAAAALLVTAAIGAIVHRPLANVPENLLKFIVGILLTAFGAFWFGEGAGIAWPGEEFSLVGLVLGFLAVAMVTIRLCSPPRREAAKVAEAGR